MFAKPTTISIVAKSQSIISYGYQARQSRTVKAVVRKHRHHAATPTVPTYILSTDLRNKKMQNYPLFKHVICCNQALQVNPEWTKLHLVQQQQQDLSVILPRWGAVQLQLQRKMLDP
jgi:hypothetical protein